MPEKSMWQGDEHLKISAVLNVYSAPGYLKLPHLQVGVEFTGRAWHADNRVHLFYPQNRSLSPFSLCTFFLSPTDCLSILSIVMIFLSKIFLPLVSYLKFCPVLGRRIYGRSTSLTFVCKCSSVNLSRTWAVRGGQGEHLGCASWRSPNHTGVYMHA